MTFFFFFVQCIIKQLLDLVFVISGIIKVSVRLISLSFQLLLITPTSTLIIPDITKTSSIIGCQSPIKQTLNNLQLRESVRNIETHLNA